MGLYRPTAAAAVIFASALGALAQGTDVAPAPNGIAFPEGYQDWRIIATSHRSDNDTLRAIVGNDQAIEAARTGQTNPWPDGAMLGKLVWKDATHANWETATVPGEFVHAEFMLKDEARFAETGGWGFARWVGAEQEPYGDTAEFAQECFGCHTPMKANDYVFTQPAVLPPVR